MMNKENGIEIEEMNEVFSNKGKNKMTNWVSVTERLPEENREVLVYTNARDYSCATIKNGQWIAYSRFMGEVSHWRELPEAPRDN